MLTGPQPFDPGYPPVVLPFAQQIGTAACLQKGEDPDQVLPYDEIQDGFNQRCFERGSGPLPLGTPVWQRLSSWESCSLQYFYARIIEWLYIALANNIRQAFRMLVPGVTVTYHAGNANLPDVITVVHPQCSVAVMDGTASFQQLATQAFLLITAPTSQGTFSTLPLWFEASSWVHNWLTADGADPTKPVMLVGHSYGGLAAECLAARYRAGNPAREIRYLTFGNPKIGDARFVDLLRQCQGLGIGNDDDLVTALPPDATITLQLRAALNQPTLLLWLLWRREPVAWYMAPDGTLGPGLGPVLDYPTARTFALRALAHLDLDPIPPHRISEYKQRILTRCPAWEWPLTPALFQFLLDAVVPVFGGGEGGGHVNAFPFLQSHGGGEGGGHVNAFPFLQSHGGGEGGGSAIIPEPHGGGEGGGSAIIPEPHGGGEGGGHS